MARPVARLAVDHAEGPEGVALGVDERDAGVGDEPMSRIAGLSRSTACSRASLTSSGSRLATACWQKECDSGELAPGGPRLREPEAALEELPVGVDERDQRDRGVEHVRGEPRQAVERR